MGKFYVREIDVHRAAWEMERRYGADKWAAAKRLTRQLRAEGIAIIPSEWEEAKTEQGWRRATIDIADNNNKEA